VVSNINEPTRRTNMAKFQVTVTRKITTSTIIDVEANSEEEARELAIDKVWNTNPRDVEWTPKDDYDWMESGPFVSHSVELSW
jgi:hypothetical protein